MQVYKSLIIFVFMSIPVSGNVHGEIFLVDQAAIKLTDCEFYRDNLYLPEYYTDPDQIRTADLCKICPQQQRYR
jgi:hypothetical protein